MRLAKTFLLLGLGLMNVATVEAAIENPKAPPKPGKPQFNPEAPPAPKWMLQDFLRLSAANPDRLIRIGARLFNPDRLRVVALEARHAHDWQHRLAMVQALSDVFDPGAERAVKASTEQRAKARKILVYALIQDPSLIVRDGAVESIRRIMRMRPQERLVWKKPLESSFLNAKNAPNGEGFFIRETILTALREGALELSPRMRKAAMADKNTRVRQQLRGWDTRAYDKL